MSRSARIGYSPLSGTGVTTVKETLEALNFDLHLVEDQATPDGSFKAVCYRIANPEVPESMDRLRELLIEKQCDMGLATDPDADRLGILVPDNSGDFMFVNGNEIGILLIESILQHKINTESLTKNPIFINTLVTTSLQRKIARAYGCSVIGDLMVGFKYMGDVMRNLEQHKRFPPAGEENGRDAVEGTIDDFVFTTEESHGYLLTPRVRDKDACGAAVFLSGLASMLKEEGRTVVDLLNDIYRVYGYTSSRLRSMVMEGIIGLERIGRIQTALRSNPPKQIAGLKVLRFVDNHKVGGPLKSSTDEAGRNVLLFELQNTCDDPIRLVVRPSGTEPKTKIYIEVPSKESLGGTLRETSKATLASVSKETLAQIKARTDKEAERIANEFVKFCLGREILGNAFPTIPSESLLVSDLVAVDHKIRLCTRILPDLIEQIENEVADAAMGAWLDIALKPFGEDPRGLIKAAARTWLDNRNIKKSILLRAEMILGIA
jgi:phosphomannomutase